MHATLTDGPPMTEQFFWDLDKKARGFGSEFIEARGQLLPPGTKGLDYLTPTHAVQVKTKNLFGISYTPAIFKYAVKRDIDKLAKFSELVKDHLGANKTTQNLKRKLTVHIPASKLGQPEYDNNLVQELIAYGNGKNPKVIVEVRGTP